MRQVESNKNVAKSLFLANNKLEKKTVLAGASVAHGVSFCIQVAHACLD